VGQTEQLKTKDQGGKRGHGDDGGTLATKRQRRKSSLSFS
jgi:hypothetical protein